MNRTPAKYFMDEADIKEAIAQWLWNEHEVEIEADDIKLHVEHKQEEPKTPYRGGMSDWVDVAIFSATAEEGE